MKKVFVSLVGLLLSLWLSHAKSDNMGKIVDEGIRCSAKQASLMAQKLIDEKEKLPRTIGKNGEFVTSDARWWTSGFFPGTLWYLYEATGDKSLKQYAEEYTERIEEEQYTTDNHDVGFMLYCSYGNGYRLTGNPEFKKVLLQGAASLSTRYAVTVKAIRSWDWNTKVWKYPVIIDNMMNLELLEWATKQSGDKVFAEIARSHADVTMKHHFRPNYSSYHLVDYDPLTGEPRLKQTVQGYSNESSWARGQGWALYGYTMMYRETKNKRYLNQAMKIADYLINHPSMPDDKIPYWDFDSSKIPNELRDASAGSIMASAFIELSLLTKGNFSQQCLSVAGKQLTALTSEKYLAKEDSNCHFILKHAVGNLPGKDEVDVPLTYADYYYVEALVRYKNWVINKQYTYKDSL